MLLLDTLVALMLVSLSGAALVGVLAAAGRDELAGRDREADLAVADRLLVAITMLGQRELDLRLGERGIGDFTVSTTRPERTLYRIAVARAATPDHELLVTVLYRAPEAGR
jgi:hypothetical protein